MKMLYAKSNKFLIVIDQHHKHKVKYPRSRSHFIMLFINVLTVTKIDCDSSLNLLEF